MAKNLLLLHIGSAPGPASHAGLAEHRALFEGAGCRLPAVPATELEAAALELLREHRAAGLRRRDVEGAWAGIARRLWRSRADLVLSQPRFAAADLAQADLLLDQLAGLETHVVLTHGTDGYDERVRSIWSRVQPVGRLHVRELPEGATDVDLAETLAGVLLEVRRARFSRPRRAWRGAHRAPRRISRTAA